MTTNISHETGAASRMKKPACGPVSPRARGFTLAEMVVALIIMAIVAAGVAVFIRYPVTAYVDSEARADLSDTADSAVRRIGRDLHLALPNSVRVTTDAAGNAYLELLLTRTGGRYLAREEFASSGNVLDFTPGNTNLKFDVVGVMPSGLQQIQGTDSIVVYNLVPGSSPNDAYASSNNNRAAIASISGNTITMKTNPFASQTPLPVASPNSRFQVVSGPVTYVCNATAQTLTRYWNYTITTPQPTSVAALTAGGGLSALLATGITTCGSVVFSYTIVNQYSALVDINLVLGPPSTDNGSGGTVSLFQQVHVDNTP